MYCSWPCYNHRKDSPNRPRAVRMVKQYTKDGELVRVYKSALNAAESLGVCANSVRDACRLKRPYKGFLWKYEEGTEKS